MTFLRVRWNEYARFWLILDVAVTVSLLFVLFFIDSLCGNTAVVKGFCMCSQSSAMRIGAERFLPEFRRTCVFGLEPRADILQRMVRWQLARKQQGTHKTKGRSEINRTGAKMFRQKGTGRARAGTSRSPIWRGGGVTFAARPRNYTQKLNKKMYRAALRSIFSELVRQERLVVVENMGLDSHKTKELAKRLDDMQMSDVLIITESADEKLLLASRNLPWVGVLEHDQVNPVSLIAYDSVVVTSAALKAIEERLA